MGRTHDSSIFLPHLELHLLAQRLVVRILCILRDLHRGRGRRDRLAALELLKDRGDELQSHAVGSRESACRLANADKLAHVIWASDVKITEESVTAVTLAGHCSTAKRETRT